MMTLEQKRKFQSGTYTVIVHVFILFLIIFWTLKNKLQSEQYFEVSYINLGLTETEISTSENISGSESSSTEKIKEQEKTPQENKIQSQTIEKLKEETKPKADPEYSGLTEKETTPLKTSDSEKEKTSSQTSTGSTETGTTSATTGTQNTTGNTGTLNPGALFSFNGDGYSMQFKGQPREVRKKILPDKNFQEEGSITLKFKVYADGTVGGIMIDASAPNNSLRFFQIAKDALKQWEFNKSALVEQEGRITFHFKLK